MRSPARPRARARRARRERPWLTSDLVRSTLAVVITLPTLIAINFGVAASLDLEIPDAQWVQTAVYGSWVLLCASFITLTLIAFLGASAPSLRAWILATRPPSGVVSRVLWVSAGGGAVGWAVSGAAVTMWTLVALALSSATPAPATVWAGIAVVPASAAMIVVSFALHYARLDAVDRAFAFPGEAAPRFADYLYLAVQVSTTFGGSDVVAVTTRARRSIGFHSILASVFNTVLVALFVSVLLRAVAPA